ncbi:1-acyl-sn-glycerol-3-phosphate acyltransferase gamma-like [Bombus vosnesenskii]|uniref:1-acyl-sn-glycerol-3-phosphate acyltransferase gamma-like n=2 Tax=Pyrobombus TaxID=144703 RepID=A0A6J3K556_9HYME|nr:1-acyl-sn-glycerol-3-phosphate acyltransferase gamma-like [Bombus vosnesenskii]XP_033347701.1 1-acyl-sn-glycerol-3-phosphate acyltransferase gamma-like [Bombus vosnesenskii]XP_050486633.1 1-acyl-sn-glycerol-3-phosphate acyltransferase gamma-like isoform X1 [Bombus huntii]XP_050486634.1 1-acyl-sn-glycerol-3-phosphate acyltransferase gamma-like isoform X1 [Bombus huntii]
MGLLSVLKQSNVIYVIFGITFLTSGLIINFFQCLLYFGLRPFSIYLYRKINCYLCYSLYSQLVFVPEWWSELDIVLYMNKDDVEKFRKNHKYILMNHRYEIDWLCGWIICERTGVLGNCKAYVKKSLQYVPILGWAWRFAGYIFMERNWEKDKEVITSQIKELVNYPDSISLLLCAEGTRFTTEKLEASQKFAQKANLPILNYHLTPRTKGFVASLPHMRGKISDIYDMQLQFKSDDPVKPTLTNLLQGKRITAYICLFRIPLEEVPEDEKGAEEWLHKHYEKKDRMAESFEQTGDFFELSGVPKLEKITLKRRYNSLVNIIFWAVVVNAPILYYLIIILLSGSIIYFSIGASSIFLICLLLQRMIGMSKISKSSSYGTDDKKLK